jgi:hypothetical protein
MRIETREVKVVSKQEAIDLVIDFCTEYLSEMEHVWIDWQLNGTSHKGLVNMNDEELIAELYRHYGTSETFIIE